MKPTLLLSACLAGVISVGAIAVPLSERFDRAYTAWDAGDYVPALEGFKAVLGAPGGDAYFDRIALLTGELYRVTELTTDGRQPRFSPDGRYLSYESGSPAATTILEVATADVGASTGSARTGSPIQLQGTGAVFSPSGNRVACLRLKPDAELAKAQAALARMQALATPDRQKVTELQRQVARTVGRQSEIVVRDLTTGREQKLVDGGLLKTQLAWSGDGREVYFVGTPEQDAKSNDIYATAEGAAQPRAITGGAAFKTSPIVARGGRYLVYSVASGSPFPAAGATPAGGRGGGGGFGTRQFALVSVADGATTMFNGGSAEFSADGSTLAFVGQAGTDYTIQVVKPGAKADPVVIKKSQDRIASASPSPDGSRVAFDMPFMPTRNTEIFCVNSDGTGEVRVSREIQPDRAPRFLTANTLIAIKGEPRHSRSYLYTLPGGGAAAPPVKLFHNNTVRTLALEYEWVPSSDGRHVLIVAERDGDTVTPDRGVYLLDLGTKISRADLLRRIDRDLASERDLRRRGAALFQPIAARVDAAVAQVSMRRLYEYQSTLFDFDTKSIGTPGNQKAADYIFETFKSFGYTPERQEFTTAGRGGAAGTKSANVLATLKGTTHPEMVYVLCAHFDSVPRGSGADDNTTGIAVLLEASRILARMPMPATIVFAAFTGEEAGDLGSHEYVRQAMANKVKLMAVLNNDMIGWTNDYHLDDTVRYTDAGIRDLQHAAAFRFSKLVTYDTKYYKSTDAAAFYDDYGAITGGLGSYPVLGNPYYHQPTDLLETVNQHLVFEATKMNIASIMGLASLRLRSPALKPQS